MAATRMVIDFEEQELPLGTGVLVPDQFLPDSVVAEVAARQLDDGSTLWLPDTLPQAKLIRMFAHALGEALADRTTGPILIWPKLEAERTEDNENGPGILYKCRCRWGKVTEITGA